MFEQLTKPLSDSELLLKIELPNEEVAQRLMIAAAANGLKPPPSIQRYVDPTPKELAAAPLLLLRAGGPGTERGHPRDGTSYDDSHACPQCGAGLVQTSPFRVRKTELPKSFLATGVADDLLLHESVAGIVASVGMRGMTLRPVLDPSGAAIPWFQVVVETTMPPMLASTRGMIRGRSGLERPCARCGRDGWFNRTSCPDSRKVIPSVASQARTAMPDLRFATVETRGRQDVLISWILRLAVAGVFLSVGTAKFGADPMWVKLFDQIGGAWFRYLTGSLQVTGAVLVLIPLTFLIGIGILACTMAGAVAVWIVWFGAPGTAIIPGALLVGLVVIGFHGARIDKFSKRQ